MKKIEFLKFGKLITLLLLFTGVHLNAQDALDFNGSTDYINAGNNASFNVGNTVTFEAWIYPEDLSSRFSLFSTRSENAAGSWQVEVGAGSGSSNVIAVTGVGTWVAESEDNAITLNQWNHIAFVRDGTTGTGSCTFYVNGNQVALQSETAYTFIDNTSDKVICAGTNFGSLFNGKIDEVRIWNSTRTQDEIQQSIYGGLAGTETGLIAYYPMNEGSGTSTTDNSSNSNTGTFIGSPTWITANIFPSEAGTQAEPYQIGSAKDLMWLAQNSDSWDSYFEQTANIDMAAYATWNSGEGFSPIGYDDVSTPMPFSGNYNGQYYYISNLTINRPSGSENQGLFGFTIGAVVTKSGVKDVTITGDNGVGALVGKANNTVISECYSTGSVTGETNVGGLAGSTNSSATIDNCYSLANTTGTNTAGGLIGEHSSSAINYSYAAGIVSGTSNPGGLVGVSNSSTTQNSFWDTQISTQAISDGGTGKTTSK
ncbi:MAG TPA: LamG domain-containing protein [Prolixibacteraceae bacterium]|nr:LamG domain-containing protein [Prolixibacteraceae bacterium]